MPNLWPTLLLMVILCASAAIGFFVHSRLPEQHRSAQSIGLVQLVIGLLVTFIAIVLGLLTTSVKAGFDTAYNARGHYAGELAQMDRCLRDYGPVTAPFREQASTWPNEPPPAKVSYPDASKMARTGENPVLASLMDDVGLKTRSLQPTDPVHKSLMAACVQDYHDLIEARWAVIEGLRMRGKGRTPLLLLAAAVIGFAPRMSAADSQAPDASVQEASFEQHCAACHAIPTTRAPTRSSMRAMAPSFIVEALTSGMMKAQGSALTSEERVALAEYLTGRKVGAEAPMAGRCAAASPPMSLDGPSFNGWGGNLENWRFQPAPSLTAADLPRLKLKWAFGVPGAVMMFGQPTVAAGRVFIAGRTAMSTRSIRRTGAITGTIAQARS